MKNEDENTSLVVKSNALINAMFDLSLQGNRFLAFAISLLDRSQTVESGKPVELEIPVLEFAETFNVPQNTAYRDIEALADQFQRKIITLQPDQTSDGSRVKVGIVTRQKYFTGEGRILLRFDEELVPHLLGLKEKFTTYRIKDVYQFARASTWRVYELLRQYKDIGKRKIEVDEFKRKVGVSGRYDRITDLKRFVLDPAIHEINMTSDIEIQYDQIKRGRKIVAIQFYILDNQRTKTEREIIRETISKSLDSKQDYAPELSKLLREEYRVSPEQARQLANLGARKIEEVKKLLPKIRARFEKIPKNKRKTNLGGYVFKALKNELTKPILPIN